MESIWQAERNKPQFEPLTGEIKTDVLIIGAGMAGILCGYLLRRAGVDCVIAEAKTVCGGVTQCTTAKLSCHHGAIYDRMLRRYGREQAALYVKANQEAVQAMRTLAEGIDCELSDAASYVYSRTDRRSIEKEVMALEQLGCRAEFTTQTELPFAVAGAVRVAGQAQLHPLKFVDALARELRIFEHTEVKALTPDGAITAQGKIRAKSIIVATHFPFSDRYGLYFLKLYQHRSYVLALQNAPTPQGMYVDASDTGLSFRSYGELLLLGGGGHRTGKQGGGWQELSGFAAKHYPKAGQLCRFATQDCMSLDDIPYIGNYSPNTPSLYVVTGFHKWGMSSSMVAARLLRDRILGRRNPYAVLFSPTRSILHKQLLVNAGESILGLINPVTPRCSHLGCALKYNKQEHSWDCTCHGSRFTEDGRVINNPAKKGIKGKNSPQHR